MMYKCFIVSVMSFLSMMASASQPATTSHKAPKLAPALVKHAMRGRLVIKPLTTHNIAPHVCPSRMHPGANCAARFKYVQEVPSVSLTNLEHGGARG